MLKIARTLEELSFEKLMKIYIEDNRERGAELWPEQPEEDRLAQAEAGFRRYLETEFYSKPGGVYALWEAEGKYASALRLEPYRDGLLMEALGTAPEERRKGYASALIRAVQDWLGKQGKVKLYSHVGKKNAASLSVHERCGFVPILDYAVYGDGTENPRAYTMLFEAGAAGKGN